MYFCNQIGVGVKQSTLAEMLLCSFFPWLTHSSFKFWKDTVKSSAQKEYTSTMLWASTRLPKCVHTAYTDILFMFPASHYSLICHLCCVLWSRCVRPWSWQCSVKASSCRTWSIFWTVSSLRSCCWIQMLWMGFRLHWPHGCTHFVGRVELERMRKTIGNKLQMWLWYCWKTWLTKLWCAGRRAAFRNTGFRCLLTFVIPIVSKWQWFNGLCELFIIFQKLNRIIVLKQVS